MRCAVRDTRTPAPHLLSVPGVSLVVVSRGVPPLTQLCHAVPCRRHSRITHFSPEV